MSTVVSRELQSSLQQLDNKKINSPGNNVAKDHDLELIWKWNASVPETIHGCVHDLITRRVQLQPDAQAICAWDGDWSYRQLDDLSTNLAYRLVDMGIGPDVLVPLCFQKSKWTPVAMLGVMKAGGASLALEPSLPQERLRRIVQQIEPRLMLCSSLTFELASQLTTQPLIVIDYLSPDTICRSRLPEVQPWNMLYVIFTSGSTGTPKGTIITHSNFCSVIHHQQAFQGYSSSCRVYDFAKYSFNITWSNFIHTLTAGGCLCIPSQQETINNLDGSIREYKANFMNITPSVGSMVRPSDLSGILKHVVFAGEALPSHFAREWARHTRVINLYGPAECTVGATLTVIDETVDTNAVAASIGRGLGSCTWIVDPSCHDKLVPVGEVGELVLEGPIVGAGYLGDAEKTAAVFIENPQWLVEGPPDGVGRDGRVYKTGDLVRYDSDGNIAFIGRKDSQVKINGQHVELGDIEWHVREHAAGGSDLQVAAELITPRDSDKPLLVAFIHKKTTYARHNGGDSKLELNKIIEGLNQRLATYLPAYMIPSAYISLNDFPKTPSGKMDRRKLKEIGSASTIQELTGQASTSLKKKAPTAAMELRLQALWAIVLGLRVDDIGLEDSFLRLGGDSIAAMKLVGIARDHGLSLTVADIFNYSVLRDMSAIVGEILGEAGPIEPFSLLNSHIDVPVAQRQAADACGVKITEIEDIFPCTPLQEGLIALTAKHSGDYVSRHVFQLHPEVDTNRLQKAWDQVVANTPILRTRIVDLSQQGLVQVVMNQSTTWASTEELISLESYQHQEKNVATALGAPLFCSGFIQEPHRFGEETRRFLIWTIHHALYDGWSEALLLEMLAQAYAGEKPAGTSAQFQSFVKHIMDIPLAESSKFWSAQFEHFEAQLFPELPSPRYEPRSDQMAVHSIAQLQWPNLTGVTASTTLRAAWSILNSCYTNTNDTVFGVTVSGRQAAVRGVDQMTGPTIATVPVRINLNMSSTIAEFLLQVQAQSIEMTAFEQTGLQRIRRQSPEAERACDFQTLLVIQPAADEKEKHVCDGIFVSASNGELWPQVEDQMVEFRTYPLSLECQLQDDGVVVSTRFDSAVVSNGQVDLLLRQLEHVLRLLCDGESHQTTLEDIKLVGDEDLDQMWRWNAVVPEPAGALVHELIDAVTRQQPEAQAICAWDGDWTYAELDNLSNQLAYVLADSGVGPEIVVPLCIEKSKWMPVAMMAVMKAGGASLALDHAQPEDRLRSIVHQVSPVVILTSVANQHLARRLAPHRSAVVVVVNDEQLPASRLRTLPAVDPSNKLYLVFTSGSTGQPKGVVVTHENIASAILHQRETLQFTKHSRIYDFASYMFDVVWCNLLHGLSAGGCVCIPSNDDRRNDPLGTAARLGANTAILTPSTIRGLDLQPLQCLRHIHFIGEPLSADDVDGLPSDLIVTNLYGPTECTTFSTAQLVLMDPASSTKRISIGDGRGLRTWLVNPTDHSKLVPLGCVGEVLLEGPLVAAGYLGAEEKTAAAFLNDPAWLLEGSNNHAGRGGRLYKTGDLARYDVDGSLHFLGRKDSQVKINGQRVELGDIEHHIQINVSYREDVNVVAEVVKPAGSGNVMLLAFIQVPSGHGAAKEDDIRKELDSLTADLQDRLLAQLPAYMIPSAYIPVRNIPVTATGKIDRRKLRELGQQLPVESLMGTKRSPTVGRRQPSTATEKVLQGLWSAVLGVNVNSISAEDNFLRIGGDSITAMRLVAAARKYRISFTVAHVFQHPRLSDLAKFIEKPTRCDSEEISHHNHEPFALLRTKQSIEGMKQNIANMINVDPSQIDDAFPCTPLQEGLLALTAKRPGDYVARFVYPLQPNVDTEHFIRAWEAVVSATPILRTRITDLGEAGLVQVIVNEPTTWTLRNESVSLEAYKLADRRLNTGLGTPMARFAIIRDTANDRRFFVWTIHHALYDGWSVALMLQKLEAAFHINDAQGIPSSPPLQTFIKHIKNIDQHVAAAYWQSQFQGLEAEIFPAIPSNSYQAISSAFIKHRILDLPWPKNEITPSMMVRAAWSLLATKYTDQSEAVFGVTVSGRQAPVVDVEQIIGPTIATIPLRVALDWSEMTLEELLRKVQTQAVEMTAFEQTGLQSIRRVSSDAEKACSFQTLLVVHPAEEDEAEQDSTGHWFSSGRDEDGEDDTTVTEHDTHALTMECILERYGMRVRIAYDANILDVERVRRLATQFEHTLRQICMPENASKTLSSIDMVSVHDKHSIWEWNNICPDAYSTCLHDVISSRARMQPDALAVNAWDGDFSYDDLDNLSTRLAYYLASLGVRPETIIPLYFEKSKWTSISMLAVMKAGGAPVLMDLSQPQDRLKAIINQIAPIMIVTSARNEKRASELTDTPVIAVSGDLLEELLDWKHSETISRAQPWNKAFLVFTSGSTGTPKGSILTHENVCSAVRYQQLAHGYRSDARVYDFTSYAFDTAWNNFMHTFTVGACLCVPSEEERKDDLPGSIDRFKPTILDITPSAATALEPTTIQSLRTLILGGERVSSWQAEKLGALVDVKLAYGPCECTPTATVATIDPKSHGEPSIGRGFGTITWITEPRDHNTLVPVGAIGELLLEGPLVGQGYLGDEEKTRAAFIHNPRWLLRGSTGIPGREGRLYKTGDLVRYNPDGTLMFLGRKDAQVKINGQRVELGEVESHMARHHSSSVELVDASYHSEIEEHIQALEALLSEALPSYMVPSVWIVVKNIPLNPSGKLNQRLVEDWLLHIDPETLARISFTGYPLGCAPPAREPKSDAERVILDACSVILNVKPADVNLDTSFISNGGDSISAMRLSSYCRAANLAFSVAMLLKSKTLANVAQSSTLATNSTATRIGRCREEFGKAFPLSPIQKWFFAQSHSDTITKKDYYCNQGFYVKLKRHVSITDVSSAIRTVVERHSMLRAQFEATENGWVQRVPEPSDALYHFGHADARSINEMETSVSKSHQCLDIKRGLVFSADLYSLPSQDQYLILIAHHLVVDLVSWRIILEDLESLIFGKKLHDVFAFQQWNVLQYSVAHSSDFSPTNVLSTKNAHNDHEFWGFTPATPNTARDHIRKNVELDNATTLLLLKSANTAYNTEPIDLILSSIWEAFFRIFPTRKRLTIFNEGHGREPWTPEIDLSHTVGWFTTLSPIHLSRSEGDSAALIVRQVKDARRRLPSNGWKYWVSRHLNERGITEFASHSSTMEVQFNYHGQFQQLERPDSLFEAVDFDDEISALGPLLPTSVLFDIDVVIERGVTKISFSWNRHLAHQESIQAWIAQINVSAQSLCHELCNKKTEKTLCDYEFINLDYRDLDELRENILPQIEQMNNSQVESIYPSSPMVDGILLSQMKGTGSYETSQTWLIKPRQPHRININDLTEAWQAVISRHSSLRTVFIPSVDASVAFHTVVLKSYRGEVILVESNNFESALSRLKEVPRVRYSLSKPSHRLVLGTILGDDRVVCKIEMSHAISDGASTSITMHDWAKAYSRELDTEELRDTSQEFSRALSMVSKDDKIAYWKRKLFGSEPCHFPRLVEIPPTSEQATATVTLELENNALRQIQQFCEACSVTPASLFQCAWALTLSAYTARDSVCFGYLASGRDLAVNGLMDAIGAFANVMICRVDISRDWSSDSLVRGVHDQVLEDLNFQHCSVADVQHELGLSFGQGLFNSILSFQNDDDGLTEGIETQHLVFSDLDWEDPTEYEITINIRHTNASVCVTMDYRLACISRDQAQGVVSLLEKFVTCLVSNNKTLSPADSEPSQNKLSRLDSISERDLQQVWNWNEILPEPVDGIVHDIISNVARQTPDASAICAWDGNFTYAVLDDMATNLAHYLVTLNVRPGVIVPLCFEKSKWMAVAILAVMKAGAASVALESTLPEERLSSIIQQVDPIVILTSSSNEQMMNRLANCTIVPLSDAHHTGLYSGPEILPKVQSCNILYVVFTSGSTGVPKGVLITHSNFSSAIRYQQAALGFHRNSRVYDFVKYAFDVTWSNFLHSMTAGACLCIPSESETLNNITDSLKHFKANFIDFTPSVAGTLRPSDLTTLDQILFSGEALTTHVATQWAENSNVLNTYGPAECTVKATFAKVGKSDAAAASIGQGFGLCTWIVHPLDHNKLVPIGVVGELLLEGPMVGAGYLNDLAKTKEVFIDSPNWLLSGTKGFVGRKSKLYKTGDLVRYNADGSMTFIGRKDGQVKINGQRLELGDVEHHVRVNLEHDAKVHVFAEVITPQASKKPILIAFVHHGGDRALIADKGPDWIAKITAGLNERLAKKVPGYMIPAVYMPLEEIPLSATGKTDRRRLRELGEQLTLEDLVALRVSGGEIAIPSTVTEKRLQSLWASVLDIKPDSISTNDSFLRIGGDSIGAMKLVGAARQAGLALTVADIFQHPKLSDMAKIVGHVSRTEPEAIPPYSLLKPDIDPQAARDQVAQLCQVHRDHIKDIFPCSPLQEGLLALTAKRAGDYVAQYILPLKDNTDVDHFRRAWERVLQMTPILRTRIVDLPGQGLVQTIIDEKPTWLQCSDVSDYQKKDENMPMGLGKPLVRYSVTKMPDNRRFVFAWTVHHALYDGWSMSRIMSRLELAYTGDVALRQCPPYQRFIQHIIRTSDEHAKHFWKGQLEGCEAQVFPKLPSATYQPTATTCVNHCIKNLHWPKTDITASTAIRASLVILAAEYTNSNDVVFGVTVSGREADVHGVDEMSGPTLATVPARVVLDWDETVKSCLHRIQTQHVQMTTFEQTGLQNIRQMGAHAKQACDFQTLLLIHPAEEAARLDNQIFSLSGRDENKDEVGAQIAQFDTYALTVECELMTSGLNIQFEFDETILSKYRVRKFAGQIEHILRQLCDVKQETLCLKDIQMISKDDLQDIWQWNASVPRTVETPVHEIIAETVTKKPEAPAVCAWDGSWNYSQLHDSSSRLAYHLVHLGVGPEIIVPICFEKSRWSPIAILGVMKAGGVCVTLDTNLPEDRLMSVVQQVEPTLILSSSENESLASRLSPEKPVVVVDEKLLLSLEYPANETLPTVQPFNTLYIVFTSGSTGIPKGVKITHSNFSSAIVHQRSAHNFDNVANARVYDFASFAFDTSWQNMLATFDCGGCLCIPSEAERRDDLAGSIERFQITHSELTPSAAMVLPFSMLKNLNTLILGGERLQEVYAKQWASVVNVKNSYGPSECTPTSTVADVDHMKFNGANIGRGRGVNTWIVDTITGDSLVPVGCIGELMLEGPLVGSGYLGDPDKTASVFIESPSWLTRGSPSHPGRKGRLYKTGDLVFYDEDGTLTYVGRKDAQVKIRGQRVELGEVESHITRHHLTRQSACFFPKSGPCANMLVSVFSIQNIQQEHDGRDDVSDQNASSSACDSSSASSTTEMTSSWSSLEGRSTRSSQHSMDFILEDRTATVQTYIQELRSTLDSSLPSYMVPTKWIALKYIPLNPSGKLNRKQLEAWLHNMDEDVYARLSDLDNILVCREPQTQSERVLIDACCRVLNLQPSQVNIERSFVANGGDSISAMRLSPQCRAENVIFSVATLLKAKSLAEVAKLSSVTTRSIFSKTEEFGKAFALSPIQQWFFDQTPIRLVNTPSHYCNQSFYVQINQPVSCSDVGDAISKVVEHHSMLRVRFQQQDGNWTQTVPEFASAIYHFESSNLVSMDELQALASHRQRSLDFERGPVFSADLCTFATGEQYLVLIAHHLIIDLVSWRIILDDMETLLTGGALMESLPFQIWNKLQQQEAKSSKFHPRNVLSTDG
ncbi:NRPS protein, partial [Claviceps maximensis]